MISGFAVPLRAEHISFFKTIIVPLHKVQSHPQFSDNLFRCISLFVTKDKSLAIDLIEGLIKYWPFANTKKE